jgi:hypothetical protein
MGSEQRSAKPKGCGYCKGSSTGCWRCAPDEHRARGSRARGPLPSDPELREAAIAALYEIVAAELPEECLANVVAAARTLLELTDHLKGQQDGATRPEPSWRE